MAISTFMGRASCAEAHTAALMLKMIALITVFFMVPLQCLVSLSGRALGILPPGLPNLVAYHPHLEEQPLLLDGALQSLQILRRHAVGAIGQLRQHAFQLVKRAV